MDEALEAIKELGGKLKEVKVKYRDIAIPTGFKIVLAECPYLMEDYLKAFYPEASIEKYAEQAGADVKPPSGFKIQTSPRICVCQICQTAPQ